MLHFTWANCVVYELYLDKVVFKKITELLSWKTHLLRISDWTTYLEHFRNLKEKAGKIPVFSPSCVPTANHTSGHSVVHFASLWIWTCSAACFWPGGRCGRDAVWLPDRSFHLPAGLLGCSWDTHSGARHRVVWFKLHGRPWQGSAQWPRGSCWPAGRFTAHLTSVPSAACVCTFLIVSFEATMLSIFDKIQLDSIPVSLNMHLGEFRETVQDRAAGCAADRGVAWRQI